MKILDADERDSSAITGTENFPFSDSADDSNGRISTSTLKEYITTSLQESVSTNETDITTNANAIVALEKRVETNEGDIDDLETDISQIEEYTVAPFDGFVEDWNSASSNTVSPDCIYFSTETNSFDMYLGSGNHSSTWESDERPVSMYNDEDGTVLKNKLFIYDGQLYTWDEDEGTLVAVVPDEEIEKINTSIDETNTTVSALKQYTVMSFDGFVEDMTGYSLVTEDPADEVYNIYFDVQNSRFINHILVDGTRYYYYSSWETDENSSDMYNDDDGTVLKDKLFICDGNLYTWEEDEGTLVDITRNEDINVLMQYTVMPFDGFAEDSSNYVVISEDPADEVYHILFDVMNSRFINYDEEEHYYPYWDTDENSDDLYNDEDGTVLKNKLFIYDGQLYTWDEDEGTLAVITPDVIDDLTSTETGVALSANQGRVLNELIATVQEQADTNATSIETLDSRITTLESTTSTHETEIASLQTQVEANTESISENKTSISELETTVNEAVTTVSEMQTTVSNAVSTVAELEETVEDAVSAVSDMEETVSEHSTKIKANTSDIEDLQEDVDELEDTVSSHTKKINANEDDIEELEDDLSSLKSTVTSNTKKITTNTNDIEDLEDALDTLESTVTSQGKKISANAEDIDDLESDVKSLTSSVNTNTSDISDNAEAIEALDGRVTTLESTVSTHETEITALQTQVEANTSNIESLDGRATTLEGTVSTHETEITALQTQIETNTGNISTNAADIDTLESNLTTLSETVSTNTANIATNAAAISDIEGTIDYIIPTITLPFAGFIEDSSSVTFNDDEVTDDDFEIYYDEENTRFVASRNSTVYYTAWDIDGVSYTSLYNDEDGILYKDKVYIYNEHLYVWDEDNDALVVAKLEVIDNLTSTDTETALSANQGRVLNEAVTVNANDIEDLQTAIEGIDERITANTSSISTNANTITNMVNTVTANTIAIKENAENIDALEESVEEEFEEVNETIEALDKTVSTNTANIATNASDIDALETSVATNTTNIATNASDIDALEASVATNTTNIATNASDINSLQTSVDEIQESIEEITAVADDEDIEGLFNE